MNIKVKIKTVAMVTDDALTQNRFQAMHDSYRL